MLKSPFTEMFRFLCMNFSSLDINHTNKIETYYYYFFYFILRGEWGKKISMYMYVFQK